jgi:hypothetical protein
MKSIQKLKAVLNAGLLLLLVAELSPASDLIGPSRTLKSVDNRVGSLTISSNPTMLDVKMDGAAIGETPVVLQDVEPGIHVIQVQDAETEIYVGPGKSIKLSWFKGRFIEIPVEVKKVPEQPVSPKKEVARKEKSEPSDKEIKLEHFYWPINPKGQIF